MTIFLCGEEVEDIWCGIYDAWMSRLGHEQVRLEPAGCNLDLFCEYRQVITTPEKAAKVTNSIRTRFSESCYEQVYKAALSQDAFRCDKIYRFLILAFAIGHDVQNRLQIPAVYEVFQMNRNLRREYDHMLGFTRFSQMQEGILLGKIGPKNDIITLLAVHFADRMPQENWILYDCSRKKAVVHPAGGGWVLVRADSALWEERVSRETDEAVFETLWRTFHSSIFI